MRFDDIAEVLRDIPHMTSEGGRVVYDFVRTNRLQNCLELGFAHGTSSCYIGAALHENGSGHLTTIDNQDARNRRPDIFALLEMTKLHKYITPILAHTSYTWELMKIIEKQTKRELCQPLFDFCFIDGAHSWEPDGFAFFLVEKLLKPGSWILFDDLRWTFSDPSMKDLDWVQRMADEQRTTPQIGKVFDLLVRQHPSFHDFRLGMEGAWGWARKKHPEDVAQEQTTKHVGIKNSISRGLRRFFGA